MAEINIKRFVDINILANVTRTTSGTRGTLVLYTPEGTNGVITQYSKYSDATDVDNDNYLNPTNFVETLKYLEIFFAHGGSAVELIQGTAYSSVTLDMLKNLDTEKILVGFVVPAADVIAACTAIIALAQNMNSDTTIYGINQKILFIRTEDETISTNVSYLAMKYSNVIGAEMTMAAYVSQIDVYKQNTVNDYAFTSETIDFEDITNEQLTTILNNNMNVDVSLGNVSRDVGGNLKDGSDLVNTFVRLVLHQTLTNRLLDLLVQKIKNSTGVAQIYSAITQELEAYRSSGYYSLDKVWEADDLSVVLNQQQYTIITKGTALIDGYYVKVMPYASLIEQERAARKAPYIYIILADQYGIRQITINGEVI